MIKPNELLKDTLFSIENNLREDINAVILAQKYGISTRHLERIFKYAFNVNMGAYIRSRKLTESLNDLLKTDNKIIDIALAFHFEFEPSYIKSFKREFGITPGKFRKTGQIVHITPPLQITDTIILPDEILQEQETDTIPKISVVGSQSYGNIPLPDSPYGYEVWSEKGNDNKFMWYGSDERGGAAFRAEWNNVVDFVGRIGYFWDEGRRYTEYKDIYCDFMFDRSSNGTAGNFSFIGAYGWTKDPLIEWYIVEDWFEDEINFIEKYSCVTKISEFKVDDGVYKIYKSERINKPSIAGISSFPQYFSIRQTRRQKGTISITKHFKEWEKLGLYLGKNLYETKFFIDVGGGYGWFDTKYASLYQE